MPPITFANSKTVTLAVLTSFVSFKFPRLRPVLEGEPVIIFEDGKPVDGNMRRERLTVDEIAAQARIQQIESLSEIKWAVLETSGQISFIKKGAGES